LSRKIEGDAACREGDCSHGNQLLTSLMVAGTAKVKRKVPTTVVPGDYIVPITVSILVSYPFSAC